MSMHRPTLTLAGEEGGQEGDVCTYIRKLCFGLDADHPLYFCSFIGMACGTFSYFLNYPSVLVSQCHLPKTRSWSTLGLNAVAPAKTPSLDHADESEQPSSVFKSVSMREV